MRKLTLRSLWVHKRRLVSTVLAVVLGVAFVSGTYVFAGTLNQVFDDLFADVNENVDARVQGEVLFSSAQGGGDQRARFPEEVVDVVSGVEGVSVAEPYASTFGFGPTNRVLDDEGEPVGASNGPPTLLESWILDDELNPYDLTEGSRAPEADDEIALNVAAAEDGGFEVGDTVTVASQFGNVDYTLVGTFTFGEADSAAGAVSAEFTLDEAQRLAGAEGQLDAVLVGAAEGVDDEEITARIAEVLPGGTEVITGEEAAAQDADSVQEGLQFFTIILTVFGVIALVVGSFIIANTFQILVAQRTRELALLRAVGASRRQVFGSVVLEAFVIGAIAAVLGILGGIALAQLVTAALEAGGADLPTSGIVVGTDAIVIGLVAGLGITVLAAVWPAIRATRVPPLAALREVAFERVRASRVRIGIGVVVLLLAALNLSAAWGADGDTDVLPTVGTGALLLIVATIVVGPAVAGPLVRVVGAVLPRLRGVAGRLAAENAARSPKRTAATASALLIGVALIGFITVFASSAEASVESEVERGLTADVIVQPTGGVFGGFGGFSPQVAEQVAEVEGVEVSAAFAAEETEVTYPSGDTATTFIGGVDTERYAQVSDPRMEEGDFADLVPGTVLVDRQIAEDSDLEIGSEVTFTLAGGSQMTLEVSGISDDLVVLAPWTAHIEDLAAASAQALDFQVFATVEEGRDVDEVLVAVEEAISEFPNLEVLDQEGFIGDLTEQLTSFVTFIYALLALSIIIAMIGVANTISLSVHERTHELGLLRAVGMTRAQLRTSIRWEAVVIAVLGTVLGLAVGLLTSYAMITALEGFGLTTFDVPVVTLVVLVVIAGGLAVLSSLLPANRASKLDVLDAIATE